MFWSLKGKSRVKVSEVADKWGGAEPLAYPSILVKLVSCAADRKDNSASANDAFLLGEWCDWSKSKFNDAAFASISNFLDEAQHYQTYSLALQTGYKSPYAFKFCSVYPPPGKRIDVVGKPEMWLYLPETIQVGNKEVFRATSPVSGVITEACREVLERLAVVTGYKVTTLHSTPGGTFAYLVDPVERRRFDLLEFYKQLESLERERY